MARARGARSQLAAAFEGSYGTAPGSGFLWLPHSRNGLDEERALLEDDTLGTRDPEDHAPDVPNVSGDMTVPVDVEAFGVWLKAALGAPTSTDNADGTYTHVYESGDWATELPSLACERQMPDVPVYEMYTGVKLDRLRFTAQRGGWIDATVSLHGQARTPSGTSQAGTPSAFASGKRFRQAHGALTIGGAAAANVVSVGIDYGNNLDRVEPIETDGVIGGLDPLAATLGLSLVMRFADTTLREAATAGTSTALTLTLTRVAAEEVLTFSVPRLFLPQPSKGGEGPQGVQVTFDARASRQTDGGPMLTATLTNAVESY